jgi:hypothetical protein
MAPLYSKIVASVLPAVSPATCSEIVEPEFIPRISFEKLVDSRNREFTGRGRKGLRKAAGT